MRWNKTWCIDIIDHDGDTLTSEYMTDTKAEVTKQARFLFSECKAGNITDVDPEEVDRWEIYATDSVYNPQ